MSTPSDLQRIVHVFYHIPTDNDAIDMQVEEWTFHQCIKERTPREILEQIENHIERTKNGEDMLDAIVDSSLEAVQGIYPAFYKVQPHYSSSMSLKNTIYCPKRT